MSCCVGTEDRCTWWKLGHRFELIRCFRLIIHQDLWSRGGSFGWIKIGDTAFLVCLEEPLVNAVSNPVDQFHSSLLPRKASTARCWLEGMLGKSS